MTRRISSEDIIDKYEKVLKHKLNSGEIEGYEIYYNETKSISIISELNRIKRTEYDYDHGVGVRVIVNDRIGFASGQRIEDAEKVINTAITLSRFNREVKGFTFTPPSNLPNLTYDYIDPEDDELVIETLMEYIKHNISFEGHTESFATVSFGRGRLINSEGLDIIEEWDSEVNLSVMIREGKVSVEESLSLPTFDDRFYDVPRVAKENVLIKSNPKRIEFQGPVIIQSDALQSLLSFYLSSFSGIRKHYKTTQFEIGDSVGSEGLTIYDDPLDVRGTERAKCDMEGTPSIKKEIVEKGILKRFAYNREYAMLDGYPLDDVGFCARTGYSSPPTVGYSNIVIPPGKGQLTSFDNVAVVRSVFGVHTINPISGKFALPIDNGYIISKSGKIGLKDQMLIGNIYQGFKNVITLGKDQEVDGPYILPWIAIDGWEIL